jgi:hypothetical protein
MKGRIKKIAAAKTERDEDRASVPHGYLYRRVNTRHLNAHACDDAIIYWQFDAFGGKNRRGIRTVLCMETADLAQAVAEVNFLCRMIDWPEPGASWDDDARDQYEFSLSRAASWHYRKKFLKSVLRLGEWARMEMQNRLDATPQKKRRQDTRPAAASASPLGDVRSGPAGLQSGRRPVCIIKGKSETRTTSRRSTPRRQKSGSRRPAPR